MMNDNVLCKILCSTVVGGVAARAGGTILGGIAAGAGGAVFTPIGPLVAGIGAMVTVGSFVSRLLDD